MNNLLLTSEQSRHTLSTTLINDVGHCGDVQGDVTKIQQVADQRSAEYNQATALQTDMIPNGATLKSQLMDALKISLQIDNDYLTWAQQQANSGCAYGFNSSYYSKATTLDSQATTDKQIFVGTWNPIAQKYSLTQFHEQATSRPQRPLLRGAAELDGRCSPRCARWCRCRTARRVADRQDGEHVIPAVPVHPADAVDLPAVAGQREPAVLDRHGGARRHAARDSPALVGSRRAPSGPGRNGGAASSGPSSG